MRQSPRTPINQPSAPSDKNSPGMRVPGAGVVPRLSRALLVSLQEIGIDTQALALRAGTSLDALSAGASPAEVERFYTQVFASFPEAGLGLRLGESLRFELLGVFGFAAVSSATYGDALRRLSRYKQALTGDRLFLLSAPESVVLRFLAGAPEAPYAAQQIDCEFSFLLSFGRRLTGHSITPRRLSLSVPPPAHAARYGEMFRCPVQFGAPYNELVLRAEDVELPLVSANPEVADLLWAKAERVHDKLTARKLSARVKTAIESQLAGATPDINSAARLLGVSGRSLQRKLQQEGTHFAQLVDEARHEAALRHLQDPGLSLAEISYLLGFSHPNSFHRAFQRWTQQTPSEYRRLRGLS